MALTNLEIVVVVAGVLIVVRFLNSRSWGRCSSKDSLKGKTFVVTGGNSGIGKATVIALAERGAHVLVACRNVEQAELDFHGLRKSGQQIICKHLDLQSFESVVQFSEDISTSLDRLDVLISNAGVYGPPFTVTSDGFELQHQVNHLSHALLQLLLLPKMVAAATPENPSRIVSVTSTLALKAKIKWNEMEKLNAQELCYERKSSYGSSKLSSVLFNMALVKRLKSNNIPVSVMMASPGLVWTNLFRYEKRSFLKLILFAPVAFAFLRSPKQGSQTVLHCATSSHLSDPKFSGQVFRNCKASMRFDERLDPEDESKVWQETMAATKNFINDDVKRVVAID